MNSLYTSYIADISNTSYTSYRKRSCRPVGRVGHFREMAPEAVRLAAHFRPWRPLDNRRSSSTERPLISHNTDYVSQAAVVLHVNGRFSVGLEPGRPNAFC